MEIQDASQISAYTTIREDIVKLVPARAKAVLDVGCSDGTLGGYLKLLNPEREIDGIEFNPDFCEKAKEKLDSIIQADLNKTSLTDLLHKDYDCIIFADVLEHLMQPEAQLKAAVNNLGADGVVIISLPNIRHISALYSIFFRGTFPRNSRGIFDQTHLRWFTVGDGIKLINSLGLKPVEMEYNLRFIDSGNGFLNKVARKFLSRFSSFYPFREFLTYQFCIKATKK